MSRKSGLSCGQIMGLLLAIFAFGCFVMWVFLKFPPTDSGHVAAWVQAFGSIGAILGAVWLFHKGREHEKITQEEKKWSDERRLILSLKSELEVRSAQYMNRVGGLIDKGNLGKLRDLVWRVPENPFSVYTSSASRLGEVQSDSLRVLIIQTYAELEGLLLTIEALKEALRCKSDGEFLAVGDDDFNYVLKTEEHHRLAMRLSAECIEEIESYLRTFHKN